MAKLGMPSWDRTVERVTELAGIQEYEIVGFEAIGARCSYTSFRSEDTCLTAVQSKTVARRRPSTSCCELEAIAMSMACEQGARKI